MAGRRKKGAEERLTVALARLLEKTLLPDLRARARMPAVAAALAEQHAREVADRRTADTPAEWTSRWLEQVGAAWVLSCVFLRTLEDRGLVPHRRIAGEGAADAEHLFFEIAPALTVRDYLLAALREVARYPGAEDLLGPTANPAFRLSPSGEGARALLDFFREPAENASGLRWRFEGTDTRFLGDLYQDLSASVRERYALLQTPGFVEDFILDLTLEPAIREYGVAETHLLDPTCGSGHFLLGAFSRIHEHRMRTQPGIDAREHAAFALGQVHGVDIDPHAVAIAKFRLTLAYLEKAGIDSLAQVPKRLPIEVVVADSLLHGAEQGAPISATAPDMFDLEDPAGASRVLGRQYQAVVGNPPYVTCKDPARREAYRERYVSAAGNFALTAPFIERFFQLAVNGGFVGLISANSFMKREFGKKLVEQVLPRIDITRVIDSSGAYVPGHGTPTVLLFGRHRMPSSALVRVVGNRRGEPILPSDPAKGRVWTAIVAHSDDVGHADDYISVFDVQRESLSVHPWSLGADAWTEILRMLDEAATRKLREVVTRVGRASISGMDAVFLQPPDLPARLGLEKEVVRAAANGAAIRCWGIEASAVGIIPDLRGRLAFEPRARWAQFLWRYRSVLAGRRPGISGAQREDWWAWSRWTHAPRAEHRIAFPHVSTHNHFALVPDDVVITGGASILELPDETCAEQHLALLGYLNSSAACYWMKQHLHSKVPVGAVLASFGMQPEDNVFEFSSATLEGLPVPDFVLGPGPVREQLAELARCLDRAARGRRECAPTRVLSGWDRASRGSLIEALAAAQQEDVTLLRVMVRDQEDLDWLVYSALGLLELPFERSHGTALPAQRPFVWLSEEPPGTLDPELTDPWARRRSAARVSPLIGMVEQPLHKRPFRDGTGRGAPDFNVQVTAAADGWLADRIEEAMRSSPAPHCLGRAEIAMKLDRSDVRAVCSLGDADMTARLQALLYRYAVPYLSALRYTESGMRKRGEWTRAWDAQRLADHGESADFTTGSLPTYTANDFRSATIWQLRGKLDVPRERFILYPAAGNTGQDLFGWAGWGCRERAVALMTQYEALQARRESADRLVPLLAGILELAPRVQQWDSDRNHGGDGSAVGLRRFVEDEARRLRLSLEDIRAWRPLATTSHREPLRKHRSGASGQK